MVSVKDVLRSHGFFTKKRMGQNFLFDPRILEQLADDAGIIPGDIVLEIGPGGGSLTQVLCSRAERVVAVELDRTLLPVLKETLAEFHNIQVINADFVRLDHKTLYTESLRAPFKVAANLPYNVATEIILLLLESGLPILGITVLVQREVAQRIAAAPGTPEYGALTCAVQYRAKAELKTRLPGNAFFPPPKVESQVVTLTPLEHPRVTVKSEEMLFRVIRCAFGMRRKTMANNLMASFSLARADAEALITKLGLEPMVRGERFSLEQMALLADELSEMKV